MLQLFTVIPCIFLEVMNDPYIYHVILFFTTCGGHCFPSECTLTAAVEIICPVLFRGFSLLLKLSLDETSISALFHK